MSPFILVIFGATGDLAHTKLMPALFSLFQKGELGEKFYIVGFARRPLSDNKYRKGILEYLKPENTKNWEEFSKNVYYQQGLFDERQGYEELIKKLNRFDTAIGACITRLFYLATPPTNYETILEFLKITKLSEGCGPAFAEVTAGKQGIDISKWTRIAIEKPFGKDLETAKALDRRLSEIFEEKQIYRIDHYLAKETVQNIITFRFANGIFEPVWNNKFIDHVQITFAEKKGIGTRGKFFEGVGMLRDVAQNHLMQLVAAVTMEQPKSFSKEGVRDARAKAIAAIQCIEPDKVAESVVRGQYDGYKDEKDVNSDSDTETFAAMKFYVNTPRFEGVPFYIRAGKEMPEDKVEVKIVFIQTCHLLFKEYGCPEIGNVLTIHIQPNEGIGLRVIAKKPGANLTLDTVDLKFSYKEEFGHKGTDAYEKLLLDIFAGDQMLFNRSDELESSWEFITGILKSWADQSSTLSYEKNTWGPQKSNELIEKDGRRWL